MLSAKDKRFIRYWEEQREGGKWKYILTYTIGGGVLVFFIPVTLFYIMGMLQFYKLVSFPIWALVIIALLISFAGSLYFWHTNDDKWRSLTGK